MDEYNGRINLSKDTMLYVVNDVFNNNIKESTSKENILKMMPEIYEKADDKKIIEMLPYKTYIELEKLIEYSKTSNDVKAFFMEKFSNFRYFEEAMIVVLRAKYGKYNYTLNPGVLEKLERLFTDQNKKIAKRYGDIENLTIGMLYSYGMVDYNFFRKQLCKYMKETISDKELKDIFFTKLNLNLLVNDYDIAWVGTNECQQFITYFDEEYENFDIGQIAVEQKSRGMKYKKFSKEEILKRKECLYDERAKKLFKFIKSKNEDIYEFSFIRLLKKNEYGEDVCGELFNRCQFESEDDIHKFMELFEDWYNNSPQYFLGGYSPTEYRNTFK